MSTFEFQQGTLPLLISIPHAGTQLPDDIAVRLTPLAPRFARYRLARAPALFVRERARRVDHPRELLALRGRPESGAGFRSAVRRESDLARMPDTHVQRRAHIYEWPRAAPRRGARPHRALLASVSRSHRGRAPADAREHGYALLWDAHSIASEIPGLFEGVLPEFNFGTRDHASCPQPVGEALHEIVIRDGKYGAVLNGRFKGGYITLHYGRPAQKIYAVQLELAERTYMDESDPTQWDEARAQSAAGLISVCSRDTSRLTPSEGRPQRRGRSSVSVSLSSADFGLGLLRFRGLDSLALSGGSCSLPDFGALRSVRVHHIVVRIGRRAGTRSFLLGASLFFLLARLAARCMRLVLSFEPALAFGAFESRQLLASPRCSVGAFGWGRSG